MSGSPPSTASAKRRFEIGAVGRSVHSSHKRSLFPRRADKNRNARAGGQSGRRQLGPHSAGSIAAPGSARSPDQLVRDLFHHVDMARRRIPGRIRRIKAVDIRQQNQEIRMHHRRHLCRQRVIVAQLQFFDGNGIIFIDHRNRSPVQEHGN